MANKVYEIVTQRIIDMIDKGTVPWRKPWSGGNALSFYNISGRRYKGINRVMLSLSPFSSPVFLTFNQAKKLGGEVKKGATAFPIFFFSFMERQENNGEKTTFPIFRYSNAFNVEQCDGIEIPAKLQAIIESKQAKNNKIQPIAAAQAIIDNMQNKPVIVVKNSDRAFYNPPSDTVVLPELAQYENAAEYYCTAFHELGHATGHQSRLNRETLTNPTTFGSHQYSVEELVAEFTATFLCAESGIDRTEVIENSAAYLANWKTALKNAPMMIVQGASKAQKAADYILNEKEELAEAE